MWKKCHILFEWPLREEHIFLYSGFYLKTMKTWISCFVWLTYFFFPMFVANNEWPYVDWNRLLLRMFVTKHSLCIFIRRKWAAHMIRAHTCIHLLTFLLTKHFIDCDNVFLKDYSYSQSAVFSPLFLIIKINTFYKIYHHRYE